jgi:hypothetical protein
MSIILHQTDSARRCCVVVQPGVFSTVFERKISVLLLLPLDARSRLLA